MTGEGPKPAQPNIRREPALNAPWVVTGLVVFLICAHAARWLLGGSISPWAFASGDLQSGRLIGLVTYQFVHANWPHVLLNAVFVLAFGAPVARYFGENLKGALLFLVFFLACGLAAALGYAALIEAWAELRGGEGDGWALLGASGAASGLMGGAVRLMQGRIDGLGDTRLGSLSGRTVIAMSFGWIAINLVLGLTGLTPGAGGAPVAWQAHIVGYFAGLLAIGIFGSIRGRLDRVLI